MFKALFKKLLNKTTETNTTTNPGTEPEIGPEIAVNIIDVGPYEEYIKRIELDRRMYERWSAFLKQIPEGTTLHNIHPSLAPAGTKTYVIELEELIHIIDSLATYIPVLADVANETDVNKTGEVKL